MKLYNKAGVQTSGTSHTGETILRKGRKSAIRSIATLGLGLALSSLTLQANAGTAIYFYSGSGVIDVSASYYYQQHILYTTDGEIAGSVDDQGYVHDLAGSVEGYIDAGPLGGPP